MKHKGIIFHTNPETGLPESFEIDLPIDTNIGPLTWGLDFIRALRERPRIFQRIIRLLMGRYAWRELIGLRDSIDKAGWHTEFSYGIEGCEYHKEKVGNLWDAKSEPKID